ncbi:MAG: GMC family oxidoreductase N-terminal domain-containing protein [Proteobacteria bacterium]|nr:GMC family oxidoreductase N-terminal domain-containing protein [Pseudomonadota bacterium]
MAADYVIVGAGSAGCLLANRLSAGGDRVVLLEAGPKDNHPMIHIPAGLRSLLAHPVLNWNYSTEGEEGTGGRRIHWPRGKTLGGSSSINGMIYVRGNPADFDGWAQRGCRGWSFDDVLPYFRKSETYRNGGDSEVRGDGGELQVEDYRTILPLTHKFVEAAQQAGFPVTADYNGTQQSGVGYCQNTRIGRRRGSTAATFLKAAKGRPNLAVETEALATRLLFEGRRCVGVAFRQRGQDREIRAEKEVLVCGGSVNSPHLLQISGVGPGAHLQSIGVETVHDLPGVGGNMSDHYIVRISHQVKDAVTINELARFPRVVPEVFKWVFRGNGALTFGATSAMVFCNSREGLASPDLQLLFAPCSFSGEAIGAFEKQPGAGVAVCPTRPESRGSIMAASGDPFQAPVIKPNYMSAENDSHVMLAGIRHTRRILESPAFAAYSGGETRPDRPIETPEDAKQYARETGTTIYHPVGTCRMGEDPMAVVDSRLRLHGMSGIRVVDASVMPEVTTGNTNAPTIMIAEKGAAMILEDNAG